MHTFFAYGTLMCPAIMKDVTGLDLRGEPATLKGFQRCLVRDEVFPAILPAPGHSVQGMIYQTLTMHAWARLDHFEGDIYERQTVSIRLASGLTAPAGTYVIAPAHTHLLTDHEWDLDHFLLYGKQHFIADYRGYASLANKKEM